MMKVVSSRCLDRIDLFSGVISVSRSSPVAAALVPYATVSGRRFVSDLRDALAKGYLSKMPSYNSIFDYFKMESLTPYLKQLITECALPLKSIESEIRG